MTSLKADALAAMVAHAREAAPAECCGLLLGRDDSVLEAVRARNLSGVSTRFVVDPGDHIGARRLARGRGLDVIGFYHSHPRSPAVPSETDVAEASYPDHLYAILSLATDPPDVALFRLASGNFLQVTFVTVA